MIHVWFSSLANSPLCLLPVLRLVSFHKHEQARRGSFFLRAEEGLGGLRSNSPKEKRRKQRGEVASPHYSRINISLDFFASGSTTSLRLTPFNTCSSRPAGMRKIRKNI